MQRSCVHATSVSFGARAVIILGEAGSGKSSLALRLIGLGGALISDDQTALRREGSVLIASCPMPQMRGVIEARGVGLLRAPHCEQASVHLIVDLGQEESARLPPSRTRTLEGVEIPLVFRAPDVHFAQAIVLFIRYGRWAPDG